MVTIVTRWPLLLERGGGWGRTSLALPAGDWLDVLGGRHWHGTVQVGELLAGLPVALLERVRATYPALPLQDPTTEPPLRWVRLCNDLVRSLGPGRQRVELLLTPPGRLTMERGEFGWWRVETPEIKPGSPLLLFD